jgi:preprotein translocase subunit SecE
MVLAVAAVVGVLLGAIDLIFSTLLDVLLTFGVG